MQSPSQHPHAPPGGYGQQPYQGPPPGAYGGQGFGPAPQKSGLGCGVIALILAAVSVPVLGILAVMAVYGVRKYIVNAKTSEARANLAVLGKQASNHYAESGALCPSASGPVPAMASSVRGMKYQSEAGEWATSGPASGFACLGFSIADPQYFQYEYEATRTSFKVRAHGDLNGDGVLSTFELTGAVQGGKLVLAPMIVETDPSE